MKIIINKKEWELPSEMTVAQFMEEKKYGKAAVWINGQQLLSAEYKDRKFRDGDNVKILRVVAGG
jgi:thiamine biosynthesis protein ThiS